MDFTFARPAGGGTSIDSSFAGGHKYGFNFRRNGQRGDKYGFYFRMQIEVWTLLSQGRPRGDKCGYHFLFEK